MYKYGFVRRQKNTENKVNSCILAQTTFWFCNVRNFISLYFLILSHDWDLDKHQKMDGLFPLHHIPYSYWLLKRLLLYNLIHTVHWTQDNTKHKTNTKQNTVFCLDNTKQKTVFLLWILIMCNIYQFYFVVFTPLYVVLLFWLYWIIISPYFDSAASFAKWQVSLDILYWLLVWSVLKYQQMYGKIYIWLGVTTFAEIQNHQPKQCPT